MSDFVIWLTKKKTSIIDLVLIFSAFFSFWPIVSFVPIAIFCVNFFTFKRRMKVCFAFFTLACSINILSFTLESRVDEKFKDITRQGFHEECRASSQERINTLAGCIDAYKNKNGHFPEFLKEVNKTAWINDNSYNLTEGGIFDNPLYYYEVIDSNSYFLAGIGRDGLPKTEDDIRPQMVTDSSKRLLEKINEVSAKQD